MPRVLTQKREPAHNGCRAQAVRDGGSIGGKPGKQVRPDHVTEGGFRVMKGDLCCTPQVMDGLEYCSTGGLVAKSYLTLETPWTIARQAPLSMGFSGQEYWRGLPCPPPGDLPHPGIKHWSLTLQADSLPSEPPGKTKGRVGPPQLQMEGA